MPFGHSHIFSDENTYMFYAGLCSLLNQEEVEETVCPPEWESNLEIEKVRH